MMGMPFQISLDEEKEMHSRRLAAYAACIGFRIDWEGAGVVGAKAPSSNASMHRTRAVTLQTSRDRLQS